MKQSHHTYAPPPPLLLPLLLLTTTTTNPQSQSQMLSPHSILISVCPDTADPSTLSPRSPDNTEEVRRRASCCVFLGSLCAGCARAVRLKLTPGWLLARFYKFSHLSEYTNSFFLSLLVRMYIVKGKGGKNLAVYG